MMVWARLSSKLRNWQGAAVLGTLAKVVMIALVIVFAVETLGLSIFWLNGGGW